jgi:hypothetical protein
MRIDIERTRPSYIVALCSDVISELTDQMEMDTANKFRPSEETRKQAETVTEELDKLLSLCKEESWFTLERITNGRLTGKRDSALEETRKEYARTSV